MNSKAKNYNEIPVKDNMKIVDNNNEEALVPEKKPITRVLDVQPKKVKRNLFSRLITGVLGPDGLPGIGSYVNDEIVKPAIKNIIFEAITSAASMAMFGERRPYRGSGHPTQRVSHHPTTNYNARYNGSSREPERKTVIVPRYGVDEFIIDDRIGAANVLTSLTEYADRYDKVSVADYYDLLGVPTKFTDNDYGWTIDTITRASIIPVRGGGYIIKFPPVEVL